MLLVKTEQMEKKCIIKTLSIAHAQVFYLDRITRYVLIRLKL